MHACATFLMPQASPRLSAGQGRREEAVLAAQAPPWSLSLSQLPDVASPPVTKRLAARGEAWHRKFALKVFFQGQSRPMKQMDRTQRPATAAVPRRRLLQAVAPAQGPKGTTQGHGGGTPARLDPQLLGEAAGHKTELQGRSRDLDSFKAFPKRK